MPYITVRVTTPGKLEITCHVTLKLTPHAAFFDIGPRGRPWSDTVLLECPKMGVGSIARVGGM